MTKLIIVIISLSLYLTSCTESAPEIPKSSAKEISSPTIPIPNATLSFDLGTNTYTYTVPANTNIKAIAFNFSLPQGATAIPAPGSMQDFTNPVKYTITAEDGSKSVMTVVVQFQKQQLTAGGQVIPENLKNLVVNSDSLLKGYTNLVRNVGGFTASQVPTLKFYVRNGQLIDPAITTMSQLLTADLLVELNTIKFNELSIYPGEHIALSSGKYIPGKINKAGFNTYAWWVMPLTPFIAGVGKAKPGIMLILTNKDTSGNLDLSNGVDIIAIFQAPQ